MCLLANLSVKKSKVSLVKKMETNLTCGEKIQLEMTLEQQQHMEQALQNPLILHKIMATSDFPELKICRSVNKTWQIISSQILLKRDACFINFRCFEKDENFYKVTRRPLSFDKNCNLDGLNELLTNSAIFPCSDFKFMNGDMGQPDVQQFLKIFRLQIKSLRLRCHTGIVLTSKSTLFEILNGLTNMDSLYLTNYEYPDEEEEDAKEFSLLLPSLKKFRWVGCSRTALKILQSSPNLELIPSINFNDSDLDILEKSNMSSKVKECPSFRKSKYNEYLTKFANMNPKLQTIKIFTPDINQQTGSQLDRILKSSEDTLKVLLMSEALVKSGVVLPKLQNLKTLTLMMMSTGNRILPIRINLPVIFPNLETVDCTHLVGCNNDDTWDKLFPPPDAYRGYLTTVQTLKIDSSSTELWMIRLQGLCPNFKHVVVSNGNNNCEVSILTRIFKCWNHLKMIDIVLSGCSENIDNFGMDYPIIFGVSHDTCDQFQATNFFQDVDEKCLQKSLRGSSIRNLRELKMFRVHLTNGYDRMPFSHLSVIHAFKLMPNLKVVLQFDHHDYDDKWINSVYGELGECVNIRHHKR